MELRHLRYFQAVAEELSFSKAAQRLHVAQPALSRAIKELEGELGLILLDRNRRSVALTAPGSVLLHDIGLLVQQLDETIRRVRRTAAGEEGELRLGYIGPPTEQFLGSVLTEFRQRYPRVTVVLQERTPERVWEMVLNGRLSVGLTRPVLADHALGLHTLLLRREPLWAAIHKGHTLLSQKQIHWKELRDEPLVILSRREGVGLYEAIFRACRQENFIPRIAHTPSLMSTVLTYVEAGAGIGVMSDSVTALGASRPLEFRPLLPEHTVDLVMVWSEADPSPPAAAFRKLVKERLANKKLWGQRLSRAA
ncbi:MAG TPA: LysR substrate-binding domain-containing protein [Candidatus Kapabacteria bacterium]|nr:LysR substrate-binding domain-containing protein [Candidatus Kapabacteria bacterium]